MKQILPLTGRKTEKFNLEHRTVLPGLADSHIHLVGYAMMLQNLDLSTTRSIEDIQRKLAGASSKRSGKSWILGRGWDQEKLRERRYPNKRDLDIVSNPVFIHRICGHIGAANSAALALSNINRNTQDPVGGVVVRESSTGEPNGVLKERALDLIRSPASQNGKELENLLLIATRRLLKMGLTSLHCILEDRRELRLVEKLRRERKIGQLIYPILTVSSNSPSEYLQRAKTAIKIYLDGSLGARTASLSKPYSDDRSTSGIMRMNWRDFREIAELAKRQKNQLCVHAIGDNAVRLAVEAFRKIFGRISCKTFRHRIEHASLTDAQLRMEMSELGLIASVQPRFIISDIWAKKRLGLDRARELYAFRSMVRQKIVMASGSDCPVENPNPFEGIWSMVTRPDRNSAEALTVREAVSTYTIGGSYASFSETSTGTLEPGKNADMIVLEQDPFRCQVQDLRTMKISHTIINGEIMSQM